ncbi:MAG: ATP-binding protein [Clostridiales bacterium]|nr:ATP-binding protein [Clostridiales bacterium]
MKDSLLNEILKEYDAYRIRERESLIQREAEVMKAIPELARLRNSLVTSFAQKARELILNSEAAGGGYAGGNDMQGKEKEADNDKDIIPEIDNLQEVKKKEAELLVKNGYPADYLTIRYRCRLCRDTGYVGELIKEKCSCLIQRLVERSYKFAELSDVERENFNTFNADVFPDTPIRGSKMTQREYMLQLKSVFWNYQEEFPNNPKKNILFTGKTGLGKTFLLNCLAKALLDKGHTVMKVTSYNLFEHLFRSIWADSPEDVSFMKERIFEVDVLIIDDLGTETRRNNFTAEELFNILNERYLKKKHTFLSTNLSLSDLKSYYSDRVTSRLFDTRNTMIFRFSGQDIRLRAALPENK